MKFYLTVALLFITGTLSLHAQAPISAPQHDSLGILARMDANTALHPESPISKVAIGFLVIVALSLRLSGVSREHSMALQERAAYHGKAYVFRTLHEGGADH